MKERKDYSLEMCETHDHLDAFPQLMFDSSSTMLHCISSYISWFIH